ncbi:hypothetical protein V1264_015635 [Littorina saxatilis]|uniref:C3H1-type domain-containing protein n=2 Tax=Littorina saxatilis TaxID=31220 RepID=A0AAN9GG79_9CAEN
MDGLDGDDMNKEEGEITDDDEVEETKTRNVANDRGDERRYENRRDSSKFHRRSDQGLFSPSSSDSSVLRYSSRDFHGPQGRPHQDSSCVSSSSSRSFMSPESPFRDRFRTWSDRREYDSYSKDYHTHSQRPHQHNQEPQGNTPASSWRQKRFYSKGNNQSPEAQDSSFRSINENPALRMDPKMQSYFNIVRNRNDTGPVNGMHPPRSSGEGAFGARTSMEEDYFQLLQNYSQLQEEIKKVEDDRSSASPSPHVDSSTDVQRGNPRQSGAVTTKPTPPEAVDRPSKTVAEAASDVSSDEMGGNSQDQVIIVDSSPNTMSVAASLANVRDESVSGLGQEGILTVASTVDEGSAVAAAFLAVAAETSESTVAEQQSAGPHSLSASPSEPVVEDEEEEEELDELQLRLLALQSTLKQTKDNGDTTPASSQSSSAVTPMKESSSKLPQNIIESSLVETESNSLSKPVDTASKSDSSSSKAHSVPKDHVQKTNSSTQHSHSSERKAEASTASQNKKTSKESSKDRSSESRSRTGRGRRDEGREKENSKRRAKDEKEKSSSSRSRPLPFAPVRLEKISLMKSRTSSLTDAARRAQRRARQTSVARQLPRPSAPTSGSRSGQSRPRTSSDRHRSSSGVNDGRVQYEERQREISKILSIGDQKERMDRLLKLINNEVEKSTSPLKPPPKLPSLTDNYEEVEMDIDSEEDMTEALQMEDIQTAMQPVPVMGADQFDSGSTDLLTSHPYMLSYRHWMGQYGAVMDPYTSVMPYVLPPLPPTNPPLPPLPPIEDSFPPPLPPDEPPPPPPPSELFSSAVATTVDLEKKTGTDEQRISKLEQFFQNITRQTKCEAEITPSEDVVPSLVPVQDSSVVELGSPKLVHSPDDFSSDKSAAFYSPSQPTDVFSSPQKAVEAAGDDDEDEDELRAQLLRALMARRKQEVQGKAASTASSRDSSPSASITASPQHIMVTKPTAVSSRKVHVKKAPLYSKRMMELPVHKPVVVQLGADSSSEDEGGHENKKLGLGLDIDSFLREQRQSVDVKGTDGSVQSSPAENRSDTRVVQEVSDSTLQLQAVLRQKEVDLAKRRQLILSDQGKLKELFGKLNKFMNNQKKAEVEAAQLRKQIEQMQKQLEFYEKYLSGNSKLVATGKQQVKQTKDNVLKRKEIYRVAAAETSSLGRKLHGPGYKLGTITPPVRDLKRKVKMGSDIGLSVTFKPSPGKKAKPNPSPLAESHNENIPSPQSHQNAGSSAKAQKMAELQRQSEQIKQRLQQIEMQGLEMMKVEAQRKEIRSTASSGNNPRQAEKSKQAASLKSLESIKLEPLDSNVTSTKSRRRSLLDMTQSPKPTLLLKGCEDLKDSDPSKTASSAPGKKAEGQSIAFKMPSGSQLRNLCKIQREKVERVLTSPAHLSHEIFSSLTQHCAPIPELKLVRSGSKQHKQEEESDGTDLPYTSSLLPFRAYRFSSYYRTKAGLTITSGTYSHKLNPNRVLCRYELQGTCNDQHCPWQHSRDYKLSDKDILMDLVSYCPSLAGVTDETPISSYASVIGDYVDSLLSQHKGKMTIDHLCLLLTDKVNAAAKHTRPHTMFPDRRPWRPSASVPSTFSLSLLSQFQTTTDTTSGARQSQREADSVLDADDVRYFVLETVAPGEEVQDMEGAVLATPADTQLWLRLAYSKLSNPARSSEECLGQALNVLSRGLESNEDSWELWVHYLALYKRHPDSAADFKDLCQTALACAPCYDIWWLLLEASTGFHAKDAVCNSALDFLCGKEGRQALKGAKENGKDLPCQPDLMGSHQMLEMLLYKVNLNIQSGRFKTALNFIKSVLGLRDSVSKERGYLKRLTHADRCVLWICLLHLMEFQCLPAALYDPANQNPGQIRSKDKLYIPWHNKANLATSLETLVQYLGQAVTVDIDKRLDSGTSSHYVMAVQNLAELLRSREKYVEACQILKPVLQCVPHLEDVWLMVADIYAGCHDVANARKVLLDATKPNLYSAKLHFHVALLEMSQENIDEALEQLEQFVLRHYDVSQEEMAKADPNLFFL